MKGIALTSENELVLTEDLVEPHVKAGEVKIKMLAGGVCGSDLSSVASGVDRPEYPWAIGHEGGGVIVEVAPDVTRLAVGDLVVIEPNFVCGHCYWCQLGESKMCEERTVIGAHVHGIFTEYTTVPADFAWKLPPGTPKNIMAALEPAVVARGAVDRYMPSKARNALVVGAGSQGLIVVQRLATAGFTPAVSEPNEENLAQAIRHGGRNVNDNPDELFDLVFETSGASAGVTTALERAEKLADVCLIGQTSKPVPLAIRPMVQKEMTIQGHLIYNHPQDFRAAVDAVSDHAEEPIGLRDAVNPSQGVRDILDARNLSGKIWIDFENWD